MPPSPCLTLLNPRALATFVTSLCLQAAASDTSLLRVTDFETAELPQIGQQKAQEDSITLVTSPVRAGKYAARTLLRSSDPEVNGGQRAEFSDGKRLTKIEMNKDYWYGLSIFVPEDFVAPVKSNAVLFQWHTQQGGPSPVLSIRVQGNEWLINGNATEKRRTLAKLPLIKGRWTDWVVHVRWSSKTDGFWTIWKDGTEVVNERDIITQYPEELGPYAKFGQYHSVDEETPKNVVFFDEYRVAGPGGSFDLVTPPGTNFTKP